MAHAVTFEHSVNIPTLSKIGLVNGSISEKELSMLFTWMTYYWTPGIEFTTTTSFLQILKEEVVIPEWKYSNGTKYFNQNTNTQKHFLIQYEF